MDEPEWRTSLRAEGHVEGEPAAIVVGVLRFDSRESIAPSINDCGPVFLDDGQAQQLVVKNQMALAEKSKREQR